MWQEIAIYIVGAGVIAYIAGWAYHTFFKKGRKKSHLNCSSCPGCALRDEKLYHQ